jgi:hypothetical protein
MMNSIACCNTGTALDGKGNLPRRDPAGSRPGPGAACPVAETEDGRVLRGPRRDEGLWRQGRGSFRGTAEGRFAGTPSPAMPGEMGSRGQVIRRMDRG